MKKITCFTVVLTLLWIGEVSAQPKIGGFVQLLYSQNQSEVQRAWFKVTGEFDDSRIGYLFILNSTGNKVLHNGFLWFKLPKVAFIPTSTISAGKFVPIFGRYWPTYPADIYAINYSQTGCRTLLVRDVGITWSIKQEIWNLELSVVNGLEAKDNNGKDDNKEKDVYGRFLIKPLPYLELASSFRTGKSEEEKSELWGADFLLGNDKIKLIGEIISSNRRENIFGWNILGIYQPVKPIQLLVWFEDRENETLGSHQNFTTLGINWFIRPQTRLALNYLIVSDDSKELLVQLQQIF